MAARKRTFLPNDCDEPAINRARELDVAWVELNPLPVPLPTPKYKR
jgi:hypothetical protein